MLSELTFGFWSGLFDTSYEDLFRRHLVACFPDRPSSGFSRKSVIKALQNLKILRNRIAHHQSVLDYPVEDLHETAPSVIGWISQDARSWVEASSRVPEIIAARPAPVPEIAVVVPAADAWGFYEKAHAYICQPGRFFRDVSHVAFYCDATVKSEVPAVERRVDKVPFSSAEVSRLYRTREPEKMRLAEVIREAMVSGWGDSAYQVFLLSPPGGDRHVSLVHDFAHARTGRGGAFVQKQRYFPVEALKPARTTADLG